MGRRAPAASSGLTISPSSTAAICSGALCVFNYSAQSTSPGEAARGLSGQRSVAALSTLYELVDDLVLRNSTRT